MDTSKVIKIFPLNFMPVVQDGFLWEPIQDGCLMYHEVSGKLVTLNFTAEAVLSYCDGEHTVSEISRELEDTMQIAAAHTMESLERLIEAGLISPPSSE